MVFFLRIALCYPFVVLLIIKKEVLIEMRLWHEKMIPLLPNRQLLCQHRECCALRGNGWGKSHSTVNYVFNYDFERLVAYHQIVMEEMEKRGYNVNEKWWSIRYRGTSCECKNDSSMLKVMLYRNSSKFGKFACVYPEHNRDYFQECINNLECKGVDVSCLRKVLKIFYY